MHYKLTHQKCKIVEHVLRKEEYSPTRGLKVPGHYPSRRLFPKARIVFDFDDTIFPTSVRKSLYNELKMRAPESKDLIKWIAYKTGIPFVGYCYPPIKKTLHELDNTVARMIQALGNFAVVTILSAATTGWLHYALRFAPKTLHALRSQNVKLVSSRDRAKSKLECLEELFLEDMYAGEIDQVISIGDSQEERMALIGLSQSFASCSIEAETGIPPPPCLFKSIKTADEPSVGVIAAQLEFFRENMVDILEFGHSIDTGIEIQRSPIHRGSESSDSPLSRPVPTMDSSDEPMPIAPQEIAQERRISFIKSKPSPAVVMWNDFPT